MAFVRPDGIFRDPNQALAIQLSALRQKRRAEIAEVPVAFVELYVARLSRLRAGVIACAGTALVFVVSLAAVAVHGPFGLPDDLARHIAAVLLGTWCLSVIAYVLTRRTGSRHFARRLETGIEPSGDSHRDLDRLRNVQTRRAALELVDRLEGPGLAWPLAGMAMSLPLLLHFLVFEIAAGFPPDPLVFGDWVVLSATLVPHCHLVLARRCFRHGRDLARGRVCEDAAISALGTTMAFSLIPGLILIGVPTVLVGVTGAAIVPAAFWDARRVHQRERHQRELAL